MSWTTIQELKQKLGRWWDNGKLLRWEVEGGDLFPLQVKLRGPSSSQLSTRFAEVSDWIRVLQDSGLELKMRSTQHRIIGANEVPTHALFRDLESVSGFLRKKGELAAFRALLQSTNAQCPALVPWLGRRPNRALELEGDWERLLRVVFWLQENPRPGLYLRQVDLPGIDTKFIEQHKGVLAEFFELVLPPEAVGEGGFEERFGFRDRPVRIRFRPLCAGSTYPPEFTDITVPREDFAGLDPGLRRVFVVENEINYLAFPAVEDALVIFGSGYKVGSLKEIPWLMSRPLFYWGDIDTHGFAILNQMRGYYPQTRSFLMDRRTFLTHEERWVVESKPTRNPLPLLTEEEQSLYQDLIHDEFGPGRRLEQELVRYGRVLEIVGQLG